MKRLDDQLLNKLIQSAGYQLLEEDAVRAPAAQDTADMDTAALDEGFSSVLRRCRRKERLRKARKITLRISAVVLALIVAFGIAMASSEALRVKILNLLYHDNEVSAEIDFVTEEIEGETTKSNGVFLISVFEPTYMTEGFLLTEGYERPLGTTYKYQDADGNELIISQSGPNASVSIDSEDRDLYEIEIEGRIALISEGEGWNILVYASEETVFKIRGNVSVGELGKVLRGLIHR